MEEEQNSFQEIEQQPAADPHRRQFNLLFTLLVLLLGFVVLLSQLNIRDKGKPISTDVSLQGYISIKVYYASEAFMSFAQADAKQSKELKTAFEKYYQEALKSYKTAIQNDPSPDNVRRIIIIVPQEQRRQYIEQLRTILSKPHKKQIPKNVGAEIEMWRVVYLSNAPISKAQTGRYESLIETLKLGWFKNLVLEDLFKRANMPEKAAVAHAAAMNSAIWTTIEITIVVLALILLVLLGIILAIVFIAKKSSGQLVAQTPISDLPAEKKSELAALLLKTFLGYLLILLGTDLALLSILWGLGYGEHALELSGMTFIIFGTNVFSGLLALAYLAHNLKQLGWTWSTIGLVSKHPLHDVLWGIGGYAAALPLVGLAVLLSRTLDKYVPTPDNPVVALAAKSTSIFEWIILFMLVSLAAPFFEEIFFRGVLFHSFLARWGAAAGIVVSAVIFAILHPLPFSFLPIMALGAVFAIITHQRGSLLPNMIAHALNNTMAFVMLTIISGS